MNGVTEFYGIKLKQTSKGVWSCDALTVEYPDNAKLIQIADAQMTEIEKVLLKHNKEVS